jgi:hypothetical protein
MFRPSSLLLLTLALPSAATFAGETMKVQDIPGYRGLDTALPAAPITLAELEEIQATLMFGAADRAALERSRVLLEPNLEAILDVWYGFVGSQPHLLASFSDPHNGTPDAAYLGRVRARFRQWILDTTTAKYDEQWLKWQFEIGRRHHRVGKNTTDGAKAAANVPVRHLIALSFPIAATLRPFLSQPGVAPEEVEVMLDAWRKVVLLQAILWTEPAVKPGDF